MSCLGYCTDSKAVFYTVLKSSTWCEFDPDTAYVVWKFVSLGFLDNIVMLQTFKHKWHCSGYGIAMGCYRRCIVPGAATVTSKLYCHYCFNEYMRTSAGHKATHKQSEFIAVNRIIIGWISDPIWCIFLWNITIYMTERNCRVGEVLGVFNKCWGLWTTYQAGGSAGDTMHVRVKPSLLNQLICHFKVPLLLL